MQTEIDRHLQTGVSEFLTALSRSLKTSVLYPPNSAVPKELRQLCWERLDGLLNDVESLDLEIDRECILFEGELALASDGVGSNLARIMHRDGLRYFRFRSGLPQREFDDFFQALLIAFVDRSGNEDVVNLLWETDLDYIEYHAVDNFVVSSELEQSQAETRSNLLDYASVIKAEQSAADAAEQAEGQDDYSCDNSLDRQSQLLSSSANLLQNVQRFSDIEKKDIWHLLEKDKEVAIEFCAVDLLFDIALAEKDYVQFAETCDTLDNVFSHLLRVENFPLLIYVIRKFRLTSDNIAEKSRQRAERIRESYQRSGDRIRISNLTEILNRSEEQDIDPIRSYLEELDWSALPQLVWMLGELERFPARWMICDLLVQKGSSKPDIITPAIYDSRWYVARNGAVILGRIGSEKCIPPLRKAMVHEDERVRWEAVSALVRIESDDALRALEQSVNDSSERIRLAVLKRLSEKKWEPAFDAINSILESSDIESFPVVELRELLRTYSVLGGTRAIRFLKKTATAWRFFGGDPVRRVKELAVTALAMQETDEATRLLNKWAEGSKSGLSEWARAALKKQSKAANA
jgi:hypothetical protein